VEPVVSVPASLPLIDHESSIAEWALQQPVGIGTMAEAEAARAAAIAEPNAVLEGVREELRELANTTGAHEVSQAVSVAAAYFEDTLGFAPTTILAAGTTGAARLGQMLREAGFGGEAMQVREIVESQMVAAPSADVPRGWLAGVRGALKS
jgi:type IV pilus assembly protein PilM